MKTPRLCAALLTAFLGASVAPAAQAAPPRGQPPPKAQKAPAAPKLPKAVAPTTQRSTTDKSADAGKRFKPPVKGVHPIEAEYAENPAL